MLRLTISLSHSSEKVFSVEQSFRLLAVPFSIVERAHEIAPRKSRNVEGTCGGGLIARALSYFARPLDYAERDCQQYKQSL